MQHYFTVNRLSVSFHSLVVLIFYSLPKFFFLPIIQVNGIGRTSAGVSLEIVQMALHLLIQFILKNIKLTPMESGTLTLLFSFCI